MGDPRGLGTAIAGRVLEGPTGRDCCPPGSRRRPAARSRRTWSPAARAVTPVSYIAGRRLQAGASAATSDWSAAAEAPKECARAAVEAGAGAPYVLAGEQRPEQEAGDDHDLGRRSPWRGPRAPSPRNGRFRPLGAAPGGGIPCADDAGLTSPTLLTSPSARRGTAAATLTCGGWPRRGPPGRARVDETPGHARPARMTPCRRYRMGWAITSALTNGALTMVRLEPGVLSFHSNAQSSRPTASCPWRPSGLVSFGGLADQPGRDDETRSSRIEEKDMMARLGLLTGVSGRKALP